MEPTHDEPKEIDESEVRQQPRPKKWVKAISRISDKSWWYLSLAISIVAMGVLAFVWGLETKDPAPAGIQLSDQESWEKFRILYEQGDFDRLRDCGYIEDKSCGDTIKACSIS